MTKKTKQNKAESKKRTEKQLQEGREKILKLFGRKTRGKSKHLSLTSKLVQKELNIDAGFARWLLGKMQLITNDLVSLNDPNNKSQDIYIINNKSDWCYANDWYYEPEELANIIDSSYFNQAGPFLQEILSNGSCTVDEKFLDEHDSELKIPSSVLEYIIDCFIAAGLINISINDKISLSKKGKKSELNYDAVKNAFVSSQLLQVDLTKVGYEPVPFENLNELNDAYRKHNEQIRVKDIQLSLRKSQVKIQHISEILFGHQDLDMDFLQILLARLKKQSPKERPDILVVTGLVQGAFQYKQKNRRKTLATSLKSENLQFKAAKMFLNELKKLNVKIIYNKSNDDNEICENRTVDALKIMSRLAKPESDADKRYVNYHQLDKLKQTKAWDFHFWFQWNVVFEYMLRCGRRLYSADEVGALYGRRIEEYFMLLETFLALKDGDPVPDPFYKKVLELKNLVIPEKKTIKDDFIVTSDYNCTIKLIDGKIVTISDRHISTITATAMVQDPTRSMRDIIRQQHAIGEETPSIFVTSHQQQAFGRIEGNTLVTCTPGMHSINLDKDSYARHVTIDPSLKKEITRRELFRAGSTSITQTADNRYLIDFYNEELLKKSKLCKERATIAFFSDIQIGSSAMRPDLFVKTMDYVLHRFLPRRPVYIFTGGDNIEGRNFQEMANQCVRMGLVRIKDQKKFLSNIYKKSLGALPVSSLKNIKLIGTIPGNHEWNSYSAYTGDVFADHLSDTIENYFEGRGISIPCRYYDKILTGDGTVVDAWVGREDIAGYGVLFSHQILKKGGGGKPAAYQGLNLIKGTGDLMRNVDLSISAHWHVPMYFQVGNKVFFINGTTESLTPFTWSLGMHNIMGNILVHLGGGLPVQLEIITANTLHQYNPQGYYSKENLAKMGFEDEDGFNPYRHGFARPVIDLIGDKNLRKEAKEQRQSGLQKFLWSETDRITAKHQSSF
ncbi:hypothetical protein ACFLZ9_01450 [Patescibacteria group bacterium]